MVQQLTEMKLHESNFTVGGSTFYKKLIYVIHTKANKTLDTQCWWEKSTVNPSYLILFKCLNSCIDNMFTTMMKCD